MKVAVLMRCSIESALAVASASVPTASTGIGAAAMRQFHDPVVDILFFEIDRFGATVARQSKALGHGINGKHALGFDRFGATVARQSKALGHGINGKHALGAEKEGAADRELSDRTCPNIVPREPRWPE